MDNISENTLEKTNGIRLSIEDRLQKYIDDTLDSHHIRSEQAINITLSLYSEQKIIKDKLKSLEESKTLSSTSKPFRPTKKSSVSDSQLEQTFNKLAKQWKEGTQFASTVREMAMHPAYQYIIGMGPKVLPYILQRLSKEQEHWFWALKAITHEDPVPPASRGNLNKMRDIWLQWGKEKAYEW